MPSEDQMRAAIPEAEVKRAHDMMRRLFAPVGPCDQAGALDRRLRSKADARAEAEDKAQHAKRRSAA